MDHFKGLKEDLRTEFRRACKPFAGRNDFSIVVSISGWNLEEGRWSSCLFLLCKGGTRILAFVAKSCFGVVPYIFVALHQG